MKLLKPQNIVEMLAAGTRDIGFAGADWVAEKPADLVELLDTGLDPVRIVAAAAEVAARRRMSFPDRTAGGRQRIRAARPGLDRRSGLDAIFVRSYGATEVFPPEDADVIVDNTATGETLAANGLVVVDELMAVIDPALCEPGAVAEPAKKDGDRWPGAEPGSVLEREEPGHGRAQCRPWQTSSR